MGIISERLNQLFGQEKRRLLADIFSREGLAEEDRWLCSLAFLQGEGDRENLTRILEVYITDYNRLRRAYEILLQGYLFCGYPKAIESFFCLNEALSGREDLSPRNFEPRPLADSELLLERGEALCREIHRDKFDKMRNKIGDFCPDLGYLMIAEGYGHILSREGVELKTRELAVVSSLTSLEARRQLHSHIRGARNVGCGDREVYEAIYTGLAWISPAKIKNSIILWREITGGEIGDKFDNIDSGRV
jgi:4-carboxymuconolactone decarboxylase